MAQNGESGLPSDGYRNIKSSTKFKKLIVCCDGTWQDRDGKPRAPTNVARLARAIDNRDRHGHEQIVDYNAGVGTGYGLINKYIGGMFGAGLDEHIREAYSFIAGNYSGADQEGRPDAIFLIGFSRGAYTARSIGGLLGGIGLLTKTAMPYFYNAYQDWQSAGTSPPTFFTEYFGDTETPEAAKRYLDQIGDLWKGTKTEDVDKYMRVYRQCLINMGVSQKVTINCIGVFDTVGSLGVPIHPKLRKLIPGLPATLRKHMWSDTRIRNHVLYGFHALALDEKRAPFSPSLWEKRDGDTSFIKQVWFPGAHGDVGGGCEETGMADITITWMMDHLSGKAITSDQDIDISDWIQFDGAYIKDYHQKRKIVHEKECKARGLPLTPNASWALGILHDTLAGFYILAGSVPRTPMRYHRTKYATDAPTEHLLENTEESIHPSVRVRMLKGGQAPMPEWSHQLITGIRRAWYRINGRLKGGLQWPNYDPMAKGQPLEHWQLEDRDQPGSLLDLSTRSLVRESPDQLWASNDKYREKKADEPQVMYEDEIRTDGYQWALLELDPYRPAKQAKEPDTESSKSNEYR